MLIRPVSDLHLEFGDWIPPQVEADLVILAGDIHLRDKAFPWIQTHFPATRTIYVNGNHEYYKNHFIPTILSHREKSLTTNPNVWFLENEGHNFTDLNLTVYGGTMWTDFNLYGDRPVAATTALGCMNDYHLIRTKDEYGDSRKFLPYDTIVQHERFLEGLAVVAKERLDKFVVVSHHAPSPRSIHQRYENDPLNPAYASNLNHLIEEYKPDLWVHGHTHFSFDYHIGRTRVVCNPRGYPTGHANNPNFNPTKVVEI